VIGFNDVYQQFIATGMLTVIVRSAVTGPKYHTTDKHDTPPSHFSTCLVDNGWNVSDEFSINYMVNIHHK